MKFRILWLFFISFFISSIKPATLEELAAELQGGIPTHGHGLIGRVRNETKHPVGIRFKKGIHDAFPEQTVVRLKSFDPVLGAGGKYFVIKKDMDGKLIMVPSEISSEKAAKFVVSRRLSRNLRDWLGFTSIDAIGLFARMDKESNRIIFDAREGDFKDESRPDCHWMIPDAMTPEKAILANRDTQSPMYIFKGKKDVIIKEEKKPIDDVWGIFKQGHDEPIFDVNADLKYGDKVHFLNQSGRGLVATIVDENGANSGQPIMFGQKVALRLDNSKFVSPKDGWHGWKVGTSDVLSGWEKLQILDGGRSNPQRMVKYSDNLTFKCWDGWAHKHRSWGIGNKGQWYQEDNVNGNMVYQPQQWGINRWQRGRYSHAEYRVDKAVLHRKINTKAEQFSDGMFEVAVINSNNAWGVNVQNKLFKWDGKTWQEKPVGFKVKSVAASPAADVYLIGLDNKLYQRLSKKEGTDPIKLPDYYDCKGMKQLAVINAAVIWGLDVEGKISSFNGLSWESKMIPGNIKAVSIAVTFEGNVRAVDESGVLWEYNNDTKKWETRDRTADNAKIVRLSGDYAVSDKRKWYRYAGGWTGPLAGDYDDVIAANGFDIIRETKNVDVEVATTLTMDNKPKPIDDKTSLQLEIVKLGMGGQIEPNGGSFAFDALPVTKSPNIYGIAVDKLPRLEPGVPLTIPPMRGQGGAYPEVSFPGNGSFVATVSAGDQGGIHLILSDKIGDNYKIRAVIGGSNNTGSAILKQVYEGNEAKDLKLMSVSPEEHPSAKVEADKYKQYWISYTLDKIGKEFVGKIKVGQGEVGEGIFMACADPDPGDPPTRAAVGSERQEINCVQPRFDDPARVKKPKRIYKTLEALPQEAIPFRMHNRGSIAFQVMASGPVSVLLEQPMDVGRDHYRVIFGDKKNTGIGLYKWKKVRIKKGLSFEEKEQYAPCAFLPNASFPGIALLPTKSKQFWISFDHGEFIIGMGNIGENDLLIYQDVAPHDQIATCRFSSQQAAQIKNVSVSPDVQLYVARKTESYAKPTKALDLYGGGVTMLIPFDWKFDQDGTAVTTFDNITLKGPDRIAGTPIPGALYTFNVTLKPDGTPDLQWLQAPENPIQKKIQRALVKADSEAAFKRQQSEMIAKAGAIDKKEKQAEAARLSAAFDQAKDVAGAIADAGGKLGGAGIAGQIAAGIATGASMAAIGAGQVFKGLADAKTQEAELVEVNAQRKALEKETEAAKLEMQRKNLEGEMNLAFTGSEQVYLDKPIRPKLSAGELPPEIVAKRDSVKQTLKEADDIVPTTVEDYQRLLTRCQNIFLSLIHPSIVGDDEVKQRIANILHKLYTTGKDVESTHKDLINLFISAYNNSYLTDEAKPVEAQRKRSWLGYFRALSTKYYAANATLELNNLFGEYVPLGKLQKESEGLVTLEVTEGDSDLFLCFVRSNELKIRNSDEELYECVIDGWSKTKSAIRIDSLGKSIKEYVIGDENLPILSSQESVKLWFNLYKGHLLIGKGEPGKNIFLSWKDPYPIPRLHHVMAGSWGTSLTIKNVQILPALPMQVPAAKKGLTKKRHTRLGIRIDKPQKSEDDEMMDIAELEAADEKEEATADEDEIIDQKTDPAAEGSSEATTPTTDVEPAAAVPEQKDPVPEEEPEPTAPKNIPDIPAARAIIEVAS